jgi:ribosomal protein S18 acetylase RimI-like enzyme
VTRALSLADREPIRAILERTGVFTAEEVRVALSLIDETFAKPDGPDPYRFVVAESVAESAAESAGESAAEKRVVGYVCFGTTPLTTGTYDLYWIAVDPTLHGAGIGTLLVDAVLAAMRTAGGRLLLIETSSREDYAKTRLFYERAGLTLEARVRDFYSAGDDRLIYAKRV